jgi:hypothetical protein
MEHFPFRFETPLKSATRTDKKCYIQISFYKSRMRHVLFLIVSFSFAQLHAQSKTDTLLQNMLLRSKGDLIKTILDQKDTFRLQIIYTQINRDQNNIPAFQNYYYNVSPEVYFNPASTVKLPLAILSLEKLNMLDKKGVDKYTTIQFDSSYAGQVPAYRDSTAKDYLPSIAHYIKKAFLVSDNDAYNRMYQFLGQGTINTALQGKGYRNTRITRQFMGFSEEQNRHTNQVRFLNGKGEVTYTQPPAYNPDPFDYSRTIKVGTAHLDRNDSLIQKPIDFTRANILALEDLQQMLQAVLFPNSVPAEKRFQLTRDDYTFLHQYLSQYPSETNYPKYDTVEFYDSYVKFYFRGSRKMPSHVRVFNKVGWAYGFLIDVSYVVDFKNKVEFMLTSTLYVNKDGVLNDNKYEYKETGWPFLYELGQAVYQFELKRPRQHAPDLKAFRIKYEQRDLKDTRKTIKEVDN